LLFVLLHVCGIVRRTRTVWYRLYLHNPASDLRTFLYRRQEFVTRSLSAPAHCHVENGFYL